MTQEKREIYNAMNKLLSFSESWNREKILMSEATGGNLYLQLKLQ